MTKDREGHMSQWTAFTAGLMQWLRPLRGRKMPGSIHTTGCDPSGVAKPFAQSTGLTPEGSQRVVCAKGSIIDPGGVAVS